MEKTEVGFEDQITRFEAACGPLTDSYPWDFDSNYKGKTSAGYLDQKLSLKKDGTFESDFTIGSIK